LHVQVSVPFSQSNGAESDGNDYILKQRKNVI